MPNLMNDIFTTSNTYTQLQTLKKESDKIRDSIMDGFKSTSAKVSEIKRTNRVYQSISRWFSKKSDDDSDHSILDDQEDELDFGFEYNNEVEDKKKTESEEDESPLQIDKDDTEKLFNAQTKEMYAIAHKNMDVKLHNAVELRKTIDTRVSEMLASIRSDDAILKKISSQLDQIIRYQTSVEDRIKNSSRTSLFDASGRLTVDSIKNFASENQTRLTKSFVQSLMDKTGLTAIDQSIAQSVQSFQHNLLLKFVELPFIKKIFDVRNAYPDKDYSNYIRPEYNRKPAIFDNTVRTSIVTIIPEYLQKITQFVTGKKYNISKHGTLTTKPLSNVFQSSINVTFDISSFTDRQLDTFTTQTKNRNTEISSADAKEVLRLLVEQYVARMYQSTHNELRSKELESGGDIAIHRHVLRLLLRSKGKTIKYWNDVLDEFASQLQTDKRYRENFAIAVNKALKQLDEAARQNLAKSTKILDTQFTQEMFDEQARLRLQYDSDKFEYEGKTYRQLIKDKVISKDSLTEEQLNHLDDRIESFEELYDKLDRESMLSSDEKLTKFSLVKQECIQKTFDILNRGVNVYFEMRKKPFGTIGVANTRKHDPKLIEQQNIISASLQQSDPYTPPERTQPAKIFVGIKNKLSSVGDKIVSKVKSPINRMKENIKSDYKTFIDDPSKYSNMVYEASEEDQQKVKEINAMLKATTQQGFSEADVAAIRTRVEGIKDSTLRVQTKKNIDGVIERGGKQKPASSLLGKALLLIFGLGKNLFTKIFSGFKKLFNFKEGMEDKRNTFIMKTVDNTITGVKQGAKTLKEGLFGNEESKGIVNRVKSGIDSVVKSKPIQALTDIGKGITNKFKESNFGKGFMKAFKLDETSPVTMADRKLRSIDEILQYGSGTVFETFVIQFDKLGDDLSKMFEKAIKRQKDVTKDANYGAFTKMRTKQPTSFSLGLIMGGISSIMTRVFSAVAKIILSLKAVQALKKTLNDALMAIIKPINKVFKALNKVLKPVMNQLTKSLTIVVDSIANIGVAIIESVAPILESTLPIIEAILPIATTIFEIQKSVMETILAPIFSIFDSIIAKDLESTSATQTTLKDTLLTLFGLTGTTAGGILSVVSNICNFFTGSVVDKAVTKSIMQQSSDMSTYGSASYQENAGLKAGIYSTIDGMTSNANKEISQNDKNADEQQTTGTSSKNKIDIPKIGSPMDGVFGSGDDKAPYKFDDNVQDALSNLKELVSGMFSMFTGEETDVSESVEKSSAEQQYKQAQYTTSNMSDEDKAEIDKKAFELFKNGTTTEQLYGESDEEYRARYEKNKAKYWAMAANQIVHDKVKAVADGTDEGAVQLISSSLGTVGENFISSMDEMNNATEAGGLERMMQDYPMNSSSDSGGEYYDEETYYEGGAGDIFKAASEVFVAAQRAVGGDLKWNGTSAYNLKFDDGMVIDKIAPTHCTSMMTAIVKRMGYYVPSGGKAYSSTYQGIDQLVGTKGGHGSNTWGLESSDGHPNIYNYDGSVSQDWIIVPKGKTQAGDITFAGIGGNVHAHMGAYKGAGGYWFGFNGGRNDSLKNSVRLGEYYLSHGTMPPSTTVGSQTEKNWNYDQLGATASTMSYGVRYVGPKRAGTVKKRVTTKTSSARSSSGSSGGKEDLIRSTAEVFEAYVNKNSAGTYMNGLYGGEIKTRSGKVRKVRPDCSGMVSAGIQELGYTLKIDGKDVGDTGLRSWQFTNPTSNTIIYDSPTATTPSKDWTVMDFDASKLQRGDITTNYYQGHGGHVSMPITNTDTAYPKGLDGGGTTNIVQSAKAAKAYLDGLSDIPWRAAMGSGWSHKPMKIWRYLGGSGSSVSTQNTRGRTMTTAATRQTAARSSRANTSSATGSVSGTVVGGNKALTAAAETMLAIKKAYGAAPTQGQWITNVRFDDGMVIDGVSAMCTGTQAAIVKRMGYYLPKGNKSYSATYQGDPYMTQANYGTSSWGINNSDGRPNIYDKNGNKSQDWVVKHDGSYQPGDIALPAGAWNYKGNQKKGWHAHMAAYKYKGKWYGFNGGNPSGSNAQTNKSINLANFYLKYGRMPNENDNINIEDYNASGGPQSNGSSPGVVIRYVGPQTGNGSRVSTTSAATRATRTVSTSSSASTRASSRTVSGSSIGAGNKNDWIRQVAMMFEGYYYNGDKVYDNGKKGLGTIHKVPMRDGRTVRVRPDCSGMLGGAISAFGYDLQYPPSSTHYNIVGYANSWKSGWNPTYIKDTNGNVSKDWEFWKIKDTTIQPGDILGREGHATFAVAGTGTNWRGMDAGGTSNIKESAKYAREYLDTGNTQWRGIKVSDMTNILRYVGGGGVSSVRSGTTSTSGSTRTATRTPSRSTASRGAVRTTTTAVNPSAPLTGSSNAEKIFNYLTRNKGMTAIGASGMMGCFEHESGMDPTNLENSFQAKWGYASGTAGDAKYTSDVNSGKESEYNFVHSRGTNKAGYGIPQFTAYGLKQSLYNNTVKKGKSIADIGVQLDEIVNAVGGRKYNGGTLLNAINRAASPTQANQYFLWRYEAGTGYNSDAAVNKAYGGNISTKRHESAEKYYRLYGSGDSYTDSVFDTGYFNQSPITQFMSNNQQGDLIYTDINENIPYQKINGPMIIPDLNVNGDQYYGDDEQTTIFNQVNYASETEQFLQHIDEILVTDYDIQSTTIRSLVEQINDELPEYMDWYFSDEDGYSDEEFTEEDDMEILQMAAAFL